MNHQLKHRNIRIHHHSTPRRPQRYPNAAQNSYYVTRFIDGTLTAVTSIGALFILFFLITL